MSKINKVNVGGVSYDIEDAALTGRFFKGTQAEWDEFSPSEKAHFYIAIVENNTVVLSEEDIQNINDITGGDGDIVSDLTEGEAIEMTNEIIGGSE